MECNSAIKKHILCEKNSGYDVLFLKQLKNRDYFYVQTTLKGERNDHKE